MEPLIAFRKEEVFAPVLAAFEARIPDILIALDTVLTMFLQLPDFVQTLKDNPGAIPLPPKAKSALDALPPAEIREWRKSVATTDETARERRKTLDSFEAMLRGEDAAAELIDQLESVVDEHLRDRGLREFVTDQGDFYLVAPAKEAEFRQLLDEIVREADKLEAVDLGKLEEASKEGPGKFEGSGKPQLDALTRRMFAQVLTEARRRRSP